MMIITAAVGNILLLDAEKIESHSKMFMRFIETFSAHLIVKFAYLMAFVNQRYEFQMLQNLLYAR